MKLKTFAVLAVVLACASAAHADKYTKKNGVAEITTQGDKTLISLVSTVGQNRCELEGPARRIDADRIAYTSDDADDKCVAVLNTKGGKLVVTTKSCEMACGNGAAGSMDGNYSKAR